MFRRHRIKNFKDLARTQLRRHALLIGESALAAVDTAAVTAANIRRQGHILECNNHRYDLRKYRNVFVIGIGKASFDCARQLEKILGDRITNGLVLDVKGGRLKHIKSRIGTHPLPSLTNMQATGEIMAILKQVDSRDLIIAIISGGGSALMCWPYDMKCSDLSNVTKLLMRRGATIQELNTVRKHLSEVQGGQFARLAHPATIIGLIFSDVPDDDLSMVASGPTYLDRTTTDDALDVLKRYNAVRACKLPYCNLIETPKDSTYFTNIRNILMVNNVVAVRAMQYTAKRLGYRTKVLGTKITGDASDVGAWIARQAQPGYAVIAAGETTVNVRGKGLGGRNQELVLGALPHLQPGQVVMSLATDGVDHSDRAGAIADTNTINRAATHHMHPDYYLRHNNSYGFFKKIGGHIETGITGANVSDVMAVLSTTSPKKSKD